MPPAEPGTDVTVSRPATATQSFNAPETNSARRLVSLDVFRGLIIAGMILVTDPGTYSAVYPQLLHAQWDGATATDMIFPSFLVIIGVAMTFSFASWIERGEDRLQLLRHVFIRSGVLIFLGLLV